MADSDKKMELLKVEVLRAAQELRRATQLGDPLAALIYLAGNVRPRFEEMTRITEAGLTADQIRQGNERRIQGMRERLSAEAFDRWLQVFGPRMEARVKAAEARGH